MSWLTDFVRPRIKKLIGEQSGISENLWCKCTGCSEMIFHRDLESNLHVCPKCEAHLRIPVKKRLEALFDEGRYETKTLDYTGRDPLKFRDKKRYSDRLRESKEKTGEEDAVILAYGKIKGVSAVIFALNFDFMAGSMGVNVGTGFIKAAQLAVAQKNPLIAIVASGGARMQEGILSLMQMPRTVAGLQLLKAERLPYIVIHTDPTTGGVSASFAMLGDIHLAEPGAVIGFAGRRVIEQTVRETLPENFQRAEYLQEHGMVDLVVPRKKIPDVVGNLLDLIMNRAPHAIEQSKM